MGDPLPALKALARSARRRILHRIAASRASRTSALAIVRKELAAVEPLLARTLRDAQLLAWLTAGQEAVRPLALPPAATAETGPVTEARGQTGTLDRPTAEVYHPRSVVLEGDSRPLVHTGRMGGGSVPPTSPHFPDEPDDPPPLIRLPQVERAARYLQTRLAYTPEEFAQLDDDARSVAFTIAKAQTLDAVEHVQRALQEDIEQGGTLKQFTTAVREALDASALADHQVETLYRTHTARAYSAGQIEVLDHPLVADEFPFVLYDHTHDARVRPEHAYLGTHGLDGTGVYWRDDPTIRKFYPPCGWNCRCVAIPLSVEDAAARGVRDAVEWLRTGVEPRHQWVAKPPFDLPKGWVPVGDRLVAV